MSTYKKIFKHERLSSTRSKLPGLHREHSDAEQPARRENILS
jgi:hypothetical protein